MFFDFVIFHSNEDKPLNFGPKLTYFWAVRSRDLNLVLLSWGDRWSPVSLRWDDKRETTELILSSMILISIPVIEITELQIKGKASSNKQSSHQKWTICSILQHHFSDLPVWGPGQTVPIPCTWCHRSPVYAVQTSCKTQRPSEDRPLPGNFQATYPENKQMMSSSMHS